MAKSIQEYLDASIEVLAASRQAIAGDDVARAIDTISDALGQRRCLLVCGNGGSASDSQHIAGELVGRYLRERRALKCYALTADSAVMTAWSNDYSYDDVFARQVHAYAEPGGVLLGLSTSGNSENVVRAFQAAKAEAMTTIAMTGEGGGRLAPLSDILLSVPSKKTPMIQQVHICLYHYICECVEKELSEKVQMD